MRFLAIRLIFNVETLACCYILCMHTSFIVQKVYIRRTIQKFHLVQNATVWIVMSMFPYAHLILLHTKLFQFPIDFWVWFKGLVITFKNSRWHRTGSLEGLRSPKTSIHPKCSHREGMFHIPSFKTSHLMGPRKCVVVVFFVIAPAFWKDLQYIQALGLLTFRKVVKTWLSTQAFGAS